MKMISTDVIRLYEQNDIILMKLQTNCKPMNNLLCFLRNTRRYSNYNISLRYKKVGKIYDKFLYLRLNNPKLCLFYQGGRFRFVSSIVFCKKISWC